MHREIHANLGLTVAVQVKNLDRESQLRLFNYEINSTHLVRKEPSSKLLNLRLN
jgi:hypothetical protein